MPTATIDGLRVNYVVKGEGIPLLMLAPGGFVAVVSRPWRRDHLLHDLPGQILRAAVGVGFEFVQDRKASHAAARDGRLLARHSFYQLHVTRQTRAKGRPALLPQHDYIAILRRPPDADPAIAATIPVLSRLVMIPSLSP